MALLVVMLVAAGGRAFAKYEEEQLALETQLQERIERILSKTLSPNSYLVTVKVDMSDKSSPTTIRSRNAGESGGNPFLTQNKFVLPGVPEKKDFAGQAKPEGSETVVNAFAAETLVTRIAISILVAPDVSNDQVRALRDFISASIPFNPLRGDELDIQRSTLLKKETPAAAGKGADAVDGERGGRSTSFTNRLLDRSMLPIYIVVAVIFLALGVLIIFLFGPVRAFLNRLLAVLPRVGEQAAYAVSNAPAKGSTPGASALGGLGAAGSVNGYGANQRRNGHMVELPFHFIHEEQLVKLPMLLKQMLPQDAAIVLAYLPPEWASRVFANLETAFQARLVQELSQAREVPADVVKQVELQVREKLPYFVGGAEWIQSVYQLTQPQVQRAILGTLNQQSPELAQSLRRKSLFFEDLIVLPVGALRLVIQEAGFPTVAQAIRDEKPEFREALLRRVAPATREILQQELELSAEDKTAAADAKSKIVTLGRQMMAEGRISFGEKK